MPQGPGDAGDIQSHRAQECGTMRSSHFAFCFCALALLNDSCGTRAAGNSTYAGSWPSFVINGAQNLGGFVVDSGGDFRIAGPGIQVSGTISNDSSVSAVAQSASALGVCTLQGRCSSLQVCSGSAVGGGCPTDDSGRPWATFALCRGPGC